MIKRVYYILAWAPIVFFIGLYLWIKTIECCGLLGPGIFLIFPVIVSALLSLAGLVLGIILKRKNEDFSFFTVAIALLPAFWFIYMWLTNQLD